MTMLNTAAHPIGSLVEVKGGGLRLYVHSYNSIESTGEVVYHLTADVRLCGKEIRINSDAILSEIEERQKNKDDALTDNLIAMMVSMEMLGEPMSVIWGQYNHNDLVLIKPAMIMYP